MASKHHPLLTLVFLVLATLTCNLSICVARRGVGFDSRRNESLLGSGESYEKILKQVTELEEVGGILTILEEGERPDKVKSHECGYHLLRKSNFYGGNGGNPRDINAERRTPCTLVSMTIHHNAHAILALTFQYRTENHETVTIGPWGRIGGTRRIINLEQSENVVEIFGRTGDFNGHRVVSALGFVTDTRGQIGPFGSIRGASFSFHTTGVIVAFYGRSDIYLNALGAYYYP